MSEFRPSSIHTRTLLVGSSLGNAEKEVAAMCVTNYLTASGDSWVKEFSWPKFVQWLDNTDSLNELYIQMLQMFGGGFIVNGLHGLVGDNFVKRQDRGSTTYFTVTPTFINFMQSYAAV